MQGVNASRLAYTAAAPAQRRNLQSRRRGCCCADKSGESPRPQPASATPPGSTAKDLMVPGDLSVQKSEALKIIRHRLLTEGTLRPNTSAKAAVDEADAGRGPGLALLNSSELAALVAQKVQEDASGALVRVRDKMTSRLAKANAYARHLEQQLRQRDRALALAAESLLLLGPELQAAEEAAAAGQREAPFVVDRSLQATRFEELGARTRRVRAQLGRCAAAVDAQCVRQVLVEWTGMAQEVRLMGSFDNWSKGLPLSPNGEGGSQGVQAFSVVVPLVPGTYDVKLLCDGTWHAIEGLPLRPPLDNNILVVEAGPQSRPPAK